MAGKARPLASGMVFGRLTLIDRFQSRDKRGLSLYKWRVRCSCGNDSVTSQSNLQFGRVASCGCYMRERARELMKKCTCAGKNKLPPGETAFNAICQNYRISARDRNRPFELSKDQMRALITANCTYCGYPPYRVRRVNKSQFTYNGIDRIDNSLGYVAGNVVPCCIDCNNAKGKRSKEEFLEWLSRFDAQHRRTTI
jgi:hypothetical protein